MGNMNIFSELASAKRGGAATAGKQFAQKTKKVATKKAMLQKRAEDQLNRGVAKAASERTKAAKAESTKAAKAAADKAARAAATRRATAAHKTKLSRAEEFENLKTQKQVDRVKAVAEAKAKATPKSAPSAARKTASGIPTDKDGVLKPAISKSKAVKPTAPSKRPKLNTAAGEAYND